MCPGLISVLGVVNAFITFLQDSTSQKKKAVLECAQMLKDNFIRSCKKSPGPDSQWGREEFMLTRRKIARLVENPLGEDVFNNTTITDFLEGFARHDIPTKVNPRRYY
jgi:hypothetical protein